MADSMTLSDVRLLPVFRREYQLQDLTGTELVLVAPAKLAHIHGPPCLLKIDNPRSVRELAHLLPRGVLPRLAAVRAPDGCFACSLMLC